MKNSPISRQRKIKSTNNGGDFGIMILKWTNFLSKCVFSELKARKRKFLFSEFIQHHNNLPIRKASHHDSLFDLFLLNKRSIISSLMLNGDPFNRCEFFKSPFAIEAAKSGILFSSEWQMGFIIHRFIINMNHPGLYLVSQIRRSLYRGRVYCSA